MVLWLGNGLVLYGLWCEGRRWCDLCYCNGGKYIWFGWMWLIVVCCFGRKLICLWICGGVGRGRYLYGFCYGVLWVRNGIFWGVLMVEVYFEF